MVSIFHWRRLRVPLKDCIFVAKQFWAPQNAFLVKSFSSLKSSSSVCKNDAEKSFTVSYLINSCGLSENNAISVSNKVCFKSLEKPDAVLKLLRDYGFTDAHIFRIVTRWPHALVACPNKTLSPKLEFFRSIGVPLPVLAHKLSLHPSVLTRSLENSLIPSYNVLKTLLQSDERVVRVFSRAPWIFGRCGSEGISTNISMLRERGVPESSIVSLVMHQPVLLVTAEKKIMANMDFLVNKFGCKPAAIAQCPLLLIFSLEKRIKPRCLVARILNEKGLKNMASVTTLLILSEEKFLKKYIADYQEDIPELLDIYQGKLSPPSEMDINQ